MEIVLQELKEVAVVPRQFKDEEKPPKFIFRYPNAADVIDFFVFNDISRTASRCFLRFENKPLLMKNNECIDYNTYAEFIALGASEIINIIHSECAAALLPLIYKTKDDADKTEKK